MGQSARELIDQYVMNTYARQPVCFVRGQGATLFDDQNRSYTDFLAGIAVCNLGHAHPGVSQAVCNQALKLTHVSNLYYTEPQARVAQLLVEHSFADRVFFCNSGAEANEGALKLARLWGKRKKQGAHVVITMRGSFHGRTLATLSATGQEKIQQGFDPLVPSFRYLDFGDLAQLDQALDHQVCAVLMEPILGEGGVVTPPPGYLAGVRDLCRQRDALLIFDEIQTGLGRSGRLFAHQHYQVEPDLMTLAKGLANGLPAGAVCAGGEAAELFTPGLHATTFGAGPVVMEAARVVLETLTAPGFLEQVQGVGNYFREMLKGLARAHPDKVVSLRGLGLMLGLELSHPAGELVGELLQRGFVVNCTQERVLRFLPPLIIRQPEIDALVESLDRVLGAWHPGGEDRK